MTSPRPWGAVGAIAPKLVSLQSPLSPTGIVPPSFGSPPARGPGPPGAAPGASLRVASGRPRSASVDSIGTLNSDAHPAGGAPRSPEHFKMCSMFHVPGVRHGGDEDDASLPFTRSHLKTCGVCKQPHAVPDICIATIEPPFDVRASALGRPQLIQCRVCRRFKTELGSREGRSAEARDHDAARVSRKIPFVEFELHRRLVLKMRMLGMNAAFATRSYLHIGTNLLIGVLQVRSSLSPSLFRSLPFRTAGDTATNVGACFRNANSPTSCSFLLCALSSRPPL